MKIVDMYTDGACSGNPGPGGYGIVMFFEGHKKEISGGYKLTTNNRMEILSIIVGLETLKYNCKVNIYSDSKYVVDSIQKGWVFKWQRNNWMKNKKDKAINIDLWEKMLKMLEFHNTSFNWVKGHANNEFNNRCDHLAREFIKTGHLMEDINYINIKKNVLN